MKNRAWFDFQRILCKKESDVNVLIWTNKEKCFLFHFKGLLVLQIIKF